MKKLFVIIWIFSFYSCNEDQKTKEKNTYQILSLLINEYGKPTIPPREIYNLKPFTDKQIDSIVNIEQNLVIYPLLEKSSYKFSKQENLDDEFNRLLDGIKGKGNSSPIDLSKITIVKPYELSILDTLKLKEDIRYVAKNFDKIINLHVVSFNQEYNKAATIIGVGSGYLNGYSSLVFLERKNGKWIIKESKTLTIS